MRPDRRNLRPKRRNLRRTGKNDKCQYNDVCFDEIKQRNIRPAVKNRKIRSTGSSSQGRLFLQNQ